MFRGFLFRAKPFCYFLADKKDRVLQVTREHLRRRAEVTRSHSGLLRQPCAPRWAGATTVKQRSTRRRRRHLSSSRRAATSRPRDLQLRRPNLRRKLHVCSRDVMCQARSMGWLSPGSTDQRKSVSANHLSLQTPISLSLDSALSFALFPFRTGRQHRRVLATPRAVSTMERRPRGSRRSASHCSSSRTAASSC